MADVLSKVFNLKNTSWWEISFDKCTFSFVKCAINIKYTVSIHSSIIELESTPVKNEEKR